jgi:uncharacterized membrane protein YozB (DUF420 family)
MERMMVSLLVAQVNLAFQTAVFVLVVVGFLFIRKHKNKAHAQIMLATVVLNIVSFMAVMAPNFRNLSSAVTGATSTFAMVHASVGALAMLLSVWVIGIWLMSPLIVVSVRMRCYSALNKKLMLAVVSFWFASLFLGFLLYAILYS